MTRNLILLVTISLLAIVVWFLEGNSIMRPINDLLQVTQRMKEGDLSARTSTQGYGFSEIRQLSDSFNEMANTIEQGDRELKGSEKKIRIAHHKTELILNATGEGIIGVDL
jgi:nitrogen fixation/metabolism regulation signal transduction histidine kinase